MTFDPGPPNLVQFQIRRGHEVRLFQRALQRHVFVLELQALSRALQARLRGVQSAAGSRDRGLGPEERRQRSRRGSGRRRSSERDGAVLHRDRWRLLLPLLRCRYEVCAWPKWEVNANRPALCITSVPGIPLYVRVFIMRMRKTFSRLLRMFSACA